MLQVAGFSADQASALFGIYATKYQKLFAIAAITFSTPLVTSMIPSLSAALAQNNRKQFLHKIRESYRLIFLTVMPIIAGFTFLAQPIITLVFARQNAGSTLLVFGMWFAVLNTIQVVQSGILIAMGHPLVSPVTTIIGMMAQAGLQLPADPHSRHQHLRRADRQCHDLDHRDDAQPAVYPEETRHKDSPGPFPAQSGDRRPDHGGRLPRYLRAAL